MLAAATLQRPLDQAATAPRDDNDMDCVSTHAHDFGRSMLTPH